MHDERRVPIYVWEVPVRLTHWVTFGSIVALSVTGVYIADPFLVPTSGAMMTTARTVHMLAVLALLLSGLLRTIWLLRGNRFARWTALVPTNRAQATELARQAAFYAFLRRDMPTVLGHNQLAAAAYLLLIALLVVETATGLVLYGALGAEPVASLVGWVRELVGLQTLRLIHHLAMWAILAIAAFHVYSCILVDHIEKNGLMSSIVSGFKYPTREEVLQARDGGPELLEGRP
jgi:Ni/Fe-hydrogenase 1 B-type cytochrome subunit